MLTHIITWSLNNRLLVLLLAGVLIATGLWSLVQLPIDAFPDTTPVQVQINTIAPALSPAEVEAQLTAPIERSIGGLPKLQEVRSISKFGLSQVTATFEDTADLFLSRQLIQERMHAVELPDGVASPELGPIATGLGEIFHYVVSSDRHTLTELTTLHDWEIKPQLQTVPGVAEVNTWGGRHRQMHVLVDPARLVKYDLTMDHLLDALRGANRTVGGGSIEQAGELHVVQGVSLTTTPQEVGGVVITARGGAPIHVRDVADVQGGYELRRGAVTAGGRGEVVLGLGFMLMGENSHAVTRRLESKLNEIRRTLPAGVDVRVVYERTELVDRVIATVRKNLLEGALLVVAVLFAFLGNLRAGLIVAAAIPLAMLFAFNAMLRFGIAASLLSLGAIDFGLVVDSAVITIENSVRRLGRESGQRPRLDIVRDAAVEVRGPTMFGELIIMIVYLPILLLEGVEGKLFRPMALTVIFALVGSLVLSLTLMPVLASLLLPRRGSEHDNLLVRAVQRVYRPLVRLALRFPRSTVTGGVLVFLAAGLLATRLGTSFLPRLYEQSIAVNTIRLAGVSLDESVRYGTQIEKLLLDEFPDEIRDIWSRTGTAEVATDAMGLEVSDVFVTLTPIERWKRARSQAELTDQMSRLMDGLPGMRAVFTQPIEMRMNEMTAGIRADLGVRIFGDDLDVLKASAAEVQHILESIPGTADVATEQVTGQPVLEIRVDPDATARLGVSAEHVLEAVEAIGGIRVGQIREGSRRFDLVVRLDEVSRRDPAALAGVLVPTETGERLPLGRLADIRQTEGPATITREAQKRRISVQCNVRGRDLGGFVAEARRQIEQRLALQPGYYLTFGGQFEHLQRAALRLAIVVPLALAAILVLLCMSTKSLRDALIIFTGAPFAAVGGVAALWLAGMPFTISAAIGFVAVCGVSMLNGLVLTATIRQKLADGLPMNEAIEQTRLLRLRPILMTALVAALGFVPMALNTGVGAEVQRPLATVVIGGVLGDNILTLLVLPALYSLFGRRGADIARARAEREIAGSVR